MSQANQIANQVAKQIEQKLDDNPNVQFLPSFPVSQHRYNAIITKKQPFLFVKNWNKTFLGVAGFIQCTSIRKSARGGKGKPITKQQGVIFCAAFDKVQAEYLHEALDGRDNNVTLEAIEMNDDETLVFLNVLSKKEWKEMTKHIVEAENKRLQDELAKAQLIG